MRIIALILLFTSISFAQEVTRDQLKFEVVQIKALSQKQKGRLSLAQENLKEVQRKSDFNLKWGIDQSTRADSAELREKEQKDRADKEHKKAIQNGRERDVFVVLFAICLTIFTMVAVLPNLARVLNISGWKMAAVAILAAGILFSVYFALIRIALYYITNLI
jgi:cation transport ATPase